MHRQPLLHALADYATRYPDEHQTVARFVQFVQTHPDCFSRDLAPGHITGSAWLVDRPGTCVLLTHHRKLGRWLQLGGHAEGETDAQLVARREAEEESGLTDLQPLTDKILDLDIHPIPARPGPTGPEPAHDHYDVRFALRATAAQQFTVSPESHALAWVPIATLQSHTTEPSMLRMAQKWQTTHI